MGDKQCPTCAGLGRKYCVNCNGTGRIIKGHYGYDADGNSVYREKQEPHVECVGTGQALCYRCRGTGRISGGGIGPPPSRQVTTVPYRKAWDDFNKRVAACDLLSTDEKSSYHYDILDVISPHRNVIEQLSILRGRWQSQWDAMGLEGTLIDASFYTLEHSARALYPDDD